MYNEEKDKSEFTEETNVEDNKSTTVKKTVACRAEQPKFERKMYNDQRTNN